MSITHRVVLSANGCDSIPYNPVFFSYASVTQTSATLYVDSTKLDKDVISHLGDIVTLRPYEAIFDDLVALKNSHEMNGETSSTNTKFLLSNRASWALSQSLGGEDKAEEVRSPIGDEKAIKNDTELRGMRNCHVRDGAALIEYFAWLEDQLLNKRVTVDEVDGADKLETFRAKKDLFVGLSFPTISSSGANAAIIHYKPEKGSCAVIDPTAIYLCDSGAQYRDGTTDTTRTIHFGTPTEMERRAYTLVLKGNIALEVAKFPKGTSGFALDTLARQFLWQEGLDYRHGTGHGVGSFLVRPARNVHGAMDQANKTTECARRPHRHRHARAILGSAASSRQRHLGRAGLLRGQQVRHPHREHHRLQGGQHAAPLRRQAVPWLRPRDAGAHVPEPD